jgi:hypothetical protein
MYSEKKYSKALKMHVIHIYSFKVIKCTLSYFQHWQSNSNDLRDTELIFNYRCLEVSNSSEANYQSRCNPTVLLNPKYIYSVWLTAGKWMPRIHYTVYREHTFIFFIYMCMYFSHTFPAFFIHFMYVCSMCVFCTIYSTVEGVCAYYCISHNCELKNTERSYKEVKTSSS